MEIKSKKSIKLYMLFLRHLAVFTTLTILLIATIVLSFYYGMASGAILPANYAEQAIEQAKEDIQNSQPFVETVIPYPCTYALFDEDDNLVGGTMTNKEIVKSKDVLFKNSKTPVSRYMLIQREDGYCIIQYDLQAHFTSPTLHELFPMPELLVILLFLVGFLSIACVIASRFGKKLNAELSPLITATDAIKQQELDFEVSPTHIQEFNTVLNSIDEMKRALGTSLKQQWNAEQNRKTQISALAHDIKTPLTIVKGNTELLLEAELSEADKELLEYIHASSHKIEQYLDLLMSAAKAESHVDFDPKSFSVSEFISEIKSEATALCLAKNITLTTDIRDLPETFYGDSVLLVSAFSNILANAIEYSPTHGNVTISISGREDMLRFTITDSGKGFSFASLKNATQQFYTEQEERSGKHYGMGLFIAESVAKKHGGNLIIANKEEGCGAVVTLNVKTHTE